MLLCHDQYWYEVVNLLLLLNLYLFCFVLFRNSGLEGKETEEGKT